RADGRITERNRTRPPGSAADFDAEIELHVGRPGARVRREIVPAVLGAELEFASGDGDREAEVLVEARTIDRGQGGQRLPEILQAEHVRQWHGGLDLQQP